MAKNELFEFNVLTNGLLSEWTIYEDSLIIITNSLTQSRLAFWVSGIKSLTGSISDNNLSSQISLYPNPANNELNINSDLEFKKHEVLDLSGRVILELRGDQTTVSLTDLPEGNYLLRSTLSTGEVGVKKFQKI